VVLRDISQVGLFWQEAPDKANGILNRTAFVTVERFAEIGRGPEDIVSTQMFCILRPVVISDGEPKLCRIAAESSSSSNAHGSCTFGFEFSHLCVSGFAFHGNLDGLVTFTAADSVCFPMTDMKAFENGLRTLFD